MGTGEEPMVETNVERIPCQFCGRKFVSESLSKHSKVCEKTSSKKRKTFNSAQQRIQGTEMAEFAPVPPVTPPPVKKTESVPSKTARSRSVKVVTITNKSNTDVPPPHPRSISKLTSPSAKSSNYEKCQYCDRCFGPKSFDRHIEWCKEQSSRINATTAATREALERLEARTKYQAPLKLRRTITKLSKSGTESIDSRSSNSSIRTENCSEISVKSSKPFPKDTALRGSYRIKPKDTPKEVNFIRQNVLRYSYRVKVPRKEKIIASSRNMHEPKDEFQEIEDWITANDTKLRSSPLPSKISPSSSMLTCSTYDEYDPFLVAQNQMKELFDEHLPEPDSHASIKRYTSANLSSVPAKESHRSKSHNKENISRDERTLGKTRSNPNTDNVSEIHFKTSPTSAFSKYSSRIGHENLIRVPRVSSPCARVDKNDHYLSQITKDDHEKYYTTNDVVYDANINRYPLISLSNLSLCSSMSVELPEDERKASNISRDTETPMPCDAMLEAHDKYNKIASVKKNVNMERMLYGKEESKDTKSNDEEENTPTDFDGLLANEQIDLTNSFNEYSCSDQDSYFGSSPETHKKKLYRDSMASKTSIDSAYNSLNRKSPVIFETHHHANGKRSSPYGDRLNNMNSSTTDLHNDFQSNTKMSKFCHECGAKFVLAIAKYCCECGVRRLVI